jgi:uncharacterized membrane protein YheB (UPF0754 family)
MLDVVVPVIAGASIGYVTNWLAIKMLFWPRDPKYLFKKQVPMTPGLFVRRRKDFSTSISKLIESRFSNADDLFAMVKKAEEGGMITNFLKNMGPVFEMAFNMYINRTTPEQFKEDCRKMAVTMRRGHIVSDTVREKIDEMSTVDIETMVMNVVQRELRVITWLGALLGAGIGSLQLFL